jgi:hypothetical protein
MRAVIDDLFPDGSDDRVDEVVPRRRPVRGVETDIESLFGQVTCHSKAHRECPLLLHSFVKPGLGLAAVNNPTVLPRRLCSLDQSECEWDTQCQI